MKRDFDLQRESAAADFGGYFPGYIVLTSYYPDGGSRSEAIGGAASVSALTSAPLAGYSRYCERPVSWSERLAGAAATSVIFGLVIAAALVTWQTVQQRARPVSRPLTVVELSLLAAPPTPKKDVAPGPGQVERQEELPKPVRAVELQPLIQLPAPSAATFPPSDPVERLDPGPPVPKTIAPKSIATPSATRVSSDAKALGGAAAGPSRALPPLSRAGEGRGSRGRLNTLHHGSRGQGALVVDPTEIGVRDARSRRGQHAETGAALAGHPPDVPDIVELTVPVEFYLH